MSPYEHTIAKFKSRVRLAVCLLLIAVIGISAWSIVSERRAIIATAERQTEGYARALAEHSESAFAESDRVLRDVLREIRRGGGIERIDRRELFQILQRQAGDSPQIGSLFLVDKNGTMFINSNEFPSRQINVADREYFLYYRNTPGADLSISKPVMSRLVNRWRFNLIRPLNPPGEPFAGLIAVANEVNYFKRFFTPASLGPHGRVLLVRNDGASLVYEPFAGNAFQSDFSSSVMFREKLPNSPSGTYHVDQSFIDQSSRIISYQRLSRFPVVAQVSLHMDDVLAPWARKAILQSSMTLGLCLVIITLTQLMFRHLNRLQAAQASLREQQEMVRLKAEQIDAANDAILLLKLDGHILHFNNALCQMTGYSQEELQGLRLHDIEPPEFVASIASNIQFLLKRGDATFESAYLRKDGAVLPIEIHARVLESGGTGLILSIVRDISERKRHELREQTRREILEEMATGAGLEELLAHIIRFVEQERQGALCSVLLVEESGTRLRHGAAPSLPDSYNRAVDGLRIAEGAGSCGTAAFRRKRVIVEEIDGHPYWKGFSPAQEAGLHACWSEPVISSDGELLGTFAIYHCEPSSPDAEEIQLVESAVHLASIAIERLIAEERREKLEDQLQHVQRIEAIGQLAGGIAHDFNNLLTPIIVYADMIQRKLPTGDPLSGKSQGIISAAHKARDLTQQLLSFSRKQMLSMQSVDLNEIINSFQDILRRTIRENIAIDICLTPRSTAIWADRGQVEQILLNLAVNAQDAIAGNGRIVVETGHVVLDNEYAKLHPGMQPGFYALLSFSDDGCGMDDETLSHIFEPFFTTKQVGHGTGLGLATVYGIVKQHEGYIKATSCVGKGTNFSIYLPLSRTEPAGQVADSIASPAVAGAPSGNSTILVVEDNDMVREMAVELLESAGYRVLVSDHPAAACNLVKEVENNIELLVTDVMMPGMNGQELYESLLKPLPDLKVLYISGYTNELFVHNGTLEEGINFLPKPFSAERLLERVGRLLAS